MTEPPRTDDQSLDDQRLDDQAGDDPATAAPRPTPGPRPSSAARDPRPAPSPRPSPTSRARRSAAGAPDGLRRPRPAPVAAGPADNEDPGSTVTASNRTETPVNLDKSAEPDVTEPSSVGSDEAQGDPAAAEHRRRAPAWLAAVLVVLLLAVAGLDGWLLTHQPTAGSKSEREHALSTAKTAVPLILSYDYRHFDSDVSAARGRLTGRAVQDYVQAMAKTIKPTATKVHAVVQAQTDGAGVEAVSGDGKQVTAVVFGEQKVSNTSLTAPRIDLFRVRVTLDLVAGQWLVSKFDQI